MWTKVEHIITVHFKALNDEEMFYFNQMFLIFLFVKRTFQGFRRRPQTSDVATWRALRSIE